MHDIGKNIVTVVLQCNNFEVVNMGVMVPCQEILARAKVEGADIVGLSGLITPSLEEMQHVAGEMQSDEHFRIKKIPLLIGGATTSRVHTAVKIAPHYEGPVVYVPDASRSVGVVQRLLSRPARDRVHRRARTPTTSGCASSMPTRSRCRSSAGRGARQQDADRLGGYAPPAPKFIGRRVFRNFDLAELAAYIDWGPFFQTWDLAGAVPGDPEGRGGRRIGARACSADGQRMLKRLIEGRWLTANGVIGFWPANTVNDDDIEIYTDESRTRGADDLVRPAPADREAGDRRRDAAEPLPRRLRRAEGRRAWPTTSACSRSRPASASRRRKQ